MSETKHTIAQIVPISMKGVRFPKRDLDLSDSAPNNGNMNSASMLSSDIIMPLAP